MSIIHPGLQNLVVLPGTHGIGEIAPAVLPTQRDRKQRHEQVLFCRAPEDRICSEHFLLQAVVVPQIGRSILVIEQPPGNGSLHVNTLYACVCRRLESNALGGAVLGLDLPLEVVDDLPLPARKLHRQVGHLQLFYYIFAVIDPRGGVHHLPIVKGRFSYLRLHSQGPLQAGQVLR